MPQQRVRDAWATLNPRTPDAPEPAWWLITDSPHLHVQGMLNAQVGRSIKTCQSAKSAQRSLCCSGWQWRHRCIMDDIFDELISARGAIWRGQHQAHRSTGWRPEATTPQAIITHAAGHVPAKAPLAGRMKRKSTYARICWLSEQQYG